MKNLILPIFILAISFNTGCKKDDPTACERLEGKWQCESWREDGEEQLGSLAWINFSLLDFDKLNGDEGDFDWTITYLDGSSETLIGDYEVNANCTEVTFSIPSEDAIRLEFDVDDDKLTMEGNLDGIAIDLKFKRD